jgi:hypothetical protein
MGLFTRKKKLAFEKTYPVLVDLAVYINNLKKSLDDKQFITNLGEEKIKAYIDKLHASKNSYFTKSRGIETINTLKDALVELAINIKAFQEELNQLPDVADLDGESKTSTVEPKVETKVGD